MKTEMIRASTPDARLISDEALTLIFTDSSVSVHRERNSTDFNILTEMNEENRSINVNPEDLCEMRVRDAYPHSECL